MLRHRKLKKNFYSLDVSNTTWEVPNQYQDLKLTGSDRFGNPICSANDARRQCTVSIKRYSGRTFQLKQEEAVKWYRELRLLKHLNHENIECLLDAFIPTEQQETYFDMPTRYLVTDFMESNLDRVLTMQILNKEHIVFISYQLFRGLKYLHSAGIAHFHIRPHNVGLNTDCEVKIFGLGDCLSNGGFDLDDAYVRCRFWDAIEIALTPDMITYTRSCKADIWSAGCVIAQMLTGEVLIPSLDPTDHIIRTLTLCGPVELSAFKNESVQTGVSDAVPPYPGKESTFNTVFKGVHPDAIDLLCKVLVVDPEERPSAEEVLEHPFLSDYRDPDDEPDCEPFDDTIEKLKLDIQELIVKICEEVETFVPRWGTEYLPDEDEDESDELKTLLEEAMQSGYVLCHIITLLLMGVAGAGKTSFLQLILNQPPPAVRESTPLAQCAIRALSISRAAVSDAETGTMWHAVSPTMFLSLLADGIRNRLTLNLVDDPLPSSPPKPMPSSSAESIETLEPSTGMESKIESTKSSNVTSLSSSASSKLQRKGSIADSLLLAVGRPAYDKLVKKDVIQKLMENLKCSDTSGKVFDDHWVYLIDSGGQPQFHELIPTFVKHVSGAAIFVKLNENLSSKPTIAYYSAGGQLCGAPYASPLTHMETIQNCLQVLQSRRNLSGEVECPRLFIVGTHRDLAATCGESVASKNEQLLEVLLSHEGLKKNLAFYRVAKPEQLIYAVDTKNPQPQDHKTVGEFRQAVMSQCKMIKKKIPLRWFILERMLQQLAQDKDRLVLSLEECQEVASDLGMDTTHLRAALEYLVRLNLFKFFPQLLPNVVFTTAQVLLDKVSDLVEYSHCLRRDPAESTPDDAGYDSESLLFRDYGLVTEKFLQRFPKHYVDGLFGSEDLMKVLTNQLVFAHTTEEKFFMPCVLPEISVQDIAKYRLDPGVSAASPLLIYCPEGLFPSSNFSSLLALLQNTSSWKVAEKRGQPTCLYKNCTKFKHVNLPVLLTLIYSYHYIEAHAQLPADLCSEICPQLADTLLEGLSNATKIQSCEHLNHQLGFFCSCQESTTTGPHLATINSSRQWCFCSKNDEYSDGLSDKQLLWFSKDSGDMGATHPPTNKPHLKLCSLILAPKSGTTSQSETIDHPSGDSVDHPKAKESVESTTSGNATPGSAPLDFTMKNLRLIKWKDTQGKNQKFCVIPTIMNEWKDMALILGIPDAERRAWATTHRENPKECCIEVFNHWLEEGSEDYPASWEGLVSLLQDIDYGQVAIELEEVLQHFNS